MLAMQHCAEPTSDEDLTQDMPNLAARIGDRNIDPDDLPYEYEYE